MADKWLFNNIPIEQGIESLNLADDEDAFEDADAGWNCEHCTFVNSHETSVCSMCDRTSSISRNLKKNKGPSPVSG